MTTKKMRRVSMINLIVGYFIAGLFVLLIVLNKNTTTEVLVVEHNNTRVGLDLNSHGGGLIDGSHVSN